MSKIDAMVERLSMRGACDFQAALSSWYPMLDSSGADLLEVVLSALVISSEIIFRHSIFCKKGIVERSGRLDGERKKVLQKSSALLGLSLAIPLFDLRAGIGVQRTPCLILAINQMLSREACLRKLLAQTCLVWQIASF